MLNRLYIVIGMLMILVLTGAFVVPRFIDWSSRRVQMEALASEALGTPVKIAGDIDFVLLPQPRLRFVDVLVGDGDVPVAQAEAVEAEFSLMDFLRDQFVVTRLLLKAPRLNLTIAEDGTFGSLLHLPETIEAGNVSIAHAEIQAGNLHLIDSRSGDQWSVYDVDGILQLSALRGPFNFAGTGTFSEETYRFRVSTSDMNPEGAMQIATSVGPESGAFSVSAEGLLQTALAPSFEGKAVYRQRAQTSDDAGAIRGDVVVTAEVSLSSDRLLLSDYTWLPDENRASTRLTGAAVVDLGGKPRFDAVISGGVVALAPRDAREERVGQAYELVRLLEELPSPPIPPIPGTVSVDISELDLRAFALRNVRFDARGDSQGWNVHLFSAQLPGDSSVNFSGQLEPGESGPLFDGKLAIRSERLDALAQIWRVADDTGILFGQVAGFSADVKLENQALALSEGDLQIGDAHGSFALTLGYGDDPSLDVRADLGSLGENDSSLLWALMPQVHADGGAFLSSFPNGVFDFKAENLDLFPIKGHVLIGDQLAARGSWSPQGLTFQNLAAQDLGGAGFTLAGEWEGALTDPRITTNGRVSFSQRSDEAMLATLFDVANLSPVMGDILLRSLPANVQVNLSDGETEDEGEQNLVIEGRAGRSDLKLQARLGKGLFSLLNAPLGLRTTLESADTADLGYQIGLPNGTELDAGPSSITLLMEGALGNSVDAQLTFIGEENKAQYTGNMVLTNPDAYRGRGQLEFELNDIIGWTNLLGVKGVNLAAVSGVGEFSFDGADSLTLSGIQALVGQTSPGQTSLGGELVRTRSATSDLITGQLTLDQLDIAGIAQLGFGAQSLLEGPGAWPDGPFNIGVGARTTRGRIAVTSEAVSFGGPPLASDAAFSVVWDDQNLRISAFQAKIGDGNISFDASMCCEVSPNSTRQVTGRWSIQDVELGRLMPQASADLLFAKLIGSGRFTGVGDSFAKMAASLAGEGSFTLQDLSIAGTNSNIFADLALRDDLSELESDAFAALVRQGLELQPMLAPQMSGLFSLGGGTIRARNLSAQNDQARLFGSFALDLSDLALSGNWRLTSVQGFGAQSLLNDNNAQVDMQLAGSLTAPIRVLDFAPMVDAIQVRALELEVDRLEQLRAEQEARAQAAAEERARIMAEEARIKVLKAIAAEEKAREEAAEAARIAEQERLAEQARLLGQDPSAQSIEQLLQDLGESRDPLLNNQPGPLELLTPLSN